MADKPELTQQQQEAFWKALHAEEAAIRRAIGDASVAWSGLESALSHIFITLGFERQTTEVAGVIFYTPTNFETRLALVDNLMTYHFVVQALPMTHMPQIYALWPLLRGRIAKKQSIRNAIAHGNLIHQDAGNLRRTRVRLSPALLDTLRLHPTRLTKQYFGMASNEINQFTNSIVRLATLLGEYDQILKAYRKGRESLRGPLLQDPELLEAVNQLAKKMKAQSQNNQDQEPPDKRSPI